MNEEYILHLTGADFDILWQVLLDEQERLEHKKENPVYVDGVDILVNKMKKIGGLYATTNNVTKVQDMG